MTRATRIKLIVGIPIWLVGVAWLIFATFRNNKLYPLSSVCLIDMPLIYLFAQYLDRASRQKQKWKAAGCCPTCGYSLTGNVSGVCPECGAGAKSNA